jgi:superfamily II DNA or RNA helicase
MIFIVNIKLICDIIFIVNMNKNKAGKNEKNEKQLTTKLSYRGYSVLKSELTEDQIKKIRKQLKVKPIDNFAQDFGGGVPSFKIYKESANKFYLPRNWGYDTFGKPQVNELVNAGKDIDIQFNGSMRPEQQPVIDAFIQKTNAKHGGGLISLPCGYGKCHGKDTPITMYDGTIKMVQDVKVGDKLMGDDSTPRNVLSLARGRELMYKIVPVKGDSYTVNESHILSLKCSVNYDKTYTKDKIVDISVKDYLELPNIFHSEDGPLLGYRTGVNFPDKPTDIEPYIFGCWLGGGAEHLDLNISNKHIPQVYKCNSRTKRLELLAGIIDSCGNVSNGGYNIIQKNEHLLDDIIYLARSLGFAAYKKPCTEETYYYTNIHGKRLEHIPVKYPSKKIQPRPQLTTSEDPLTTRIKPEKMRVDDYYGFELDGNHRYLLGDFTVTHNTILGLYLVTQLKKKAIIIVHKTFLLNQWVERIATFIPSARVGIIQQNKIQVEDKDIVIGMLQSISMKDYHENTFKEFGFAIYDECHHLGAEVFCKSFSKICPKYVLGLSATMERKDGLTKVFKYHIGDILFYIEKREESDVGVRMVQYECDAPEYCAVEYNFAGKVNSPKMITQICEYPKRTNLIIEEIRSAHQATDVVDEDLHKDKKRQIILLSDRRDHLREIKELVEKDKICSVGFYVGGMKKVDLKQSESKDLILGTYSMASEGMDIPSLNTIILASPKSDVEQSVGRILRQKENQRTHIPLVIDIVDKNIPNFLRQSYKRKKFYEKNNYTINRIKVTDKNNQPRKTVDMGSNIQNMGKNKTDPNQTPIAMLLQQKKCLIDSESEEDEKDTNKNKNKNKIKVEFIE